VLIISGVWAVRKPEIFSPYRWRSRRCSCFLSRTQRSSQYPWLKTGCADLLLHPLTSECYVHLSKGHFLFLNSLSSPVKCPSVTRALAWDWSYPLRQANALWATCPSERCDYMLSFHFLTSTTVISAEVWFSLQFSTVYLGKSGKN